jgi:hypothetical protein
MKMCLGFVAIIVIGGSAAAQSAATAELHVTAKDPNGLLVKNATVTVSNAARNIQRTGVQNSDGDYQFLSLPPGQYNVSVQAPGFAKTTATNVTLTVGQRAELPVTLQVAAVESVVNVTGQAELIETQRTAVATTVDQVRIDSLPINERNYLAFAETSSQVTRDSGKPVGPAPTSGLNIGGQRGRSTLVQVDGADNTDTSVNAARSTLSQEAVQEFQVITNSYAAEYGRASGGVVNVVSKSGTNALHGDMFGFLRHRSFQAKNAFAPIADPPFTRTQYGASLGGPIKKDKTWFFAAFEQRRRQESGFFTSNVSSGLTDSVAINGQTFANLTKDQATYIRNLLALPGGVGVPLAVPYAFLASGGASTALTGNNPLAVFPGLCPPAPAVCLTPITPLTAVGPRFYSGAPVPLTTTDAQGNPIAFRALTQLQKIFPVSEGTSFSSLRLDHQLSNKHQFVARGGFNVSRINGIQTESQNQSLGQNDFSRTGVQEFHDWSGMAGVTSTLSQRLVNDARFNYGRRAAAFRSGVGDAVAVNIPGAAYFGRELFSPVHRVETRYEITDNLSWSRGHHTFKFGGDVNFIDVGATFELNFAGLFNFGSLAASNLNSAFAAAPGCTPGAVNCAPDFTAVQTYGLGFPQNYIQGFGNPRSGLSNKPIAFFAQDSWQIRPNLTINYGVRYDIELTQKLNPVGIKDPLTGITLSAADMLAAQNAVKVQQGVPIDKNNIAPRLAIAWDPFKDGKTVVRAAYGLFYDHPLQAIAFNSDIADSAQQQQFITGPNLPTPTLALNATQIFQGTVCVPGAPLTPVCAALPAGSFTPGVAPGSDYQFGRMRFNDQTFPGFGPSLPFTLPIAKNFQYSYANQASFTVEHQFTSSLSVSMGYVFVGNRHLPRPIDVNAPVTSSLVQNYLDFTANALKPAGIQPTSTTQAVGLSLPLASNASYTVLIPGLVVVNNFNGKRIVNPAVANFFRPSGPNYFLLAARTGGLVPKTAFDAAIAGSLLSPGVITPFGETDAQSSNGTSNYNAFNVEVKKRFSRNFQFMASYTWSHTIDDSSDLQTLLKPQDNRDLRAERADSLFDQRHRFVFSGVVTSPAAWRSGSGFTRVLADFSVAPIVEISSGRPFNILSGSDTNQDFGNQTDRPSVGANNVLVLPAPFTDGNLRRNAGITTHYASFDMRINRVIPITERLKMNVIAEGFNLFNKFNEAAASPDFVSVNAFGKMSGTKYLSIPTAAYDPRQFQFGLKLLW